MSRLEVQITFINGNEVYEDDTEKMAVNRFCEILGNDAVKLNPAYPVGTEIALFDQETQKVLMRYTVGYE